MPWSTARSLSQSATAENEKTPDAQGFSGDFKNPQAKYMGHTGLEQPKNPMRKTSDSEEVGAKSGAPNLQMQNATNIALCTIRAGSVAAIETACYTATSLRTVKGINQSVQDQTGANQNAIGSFAEALLMLARLPLTDTERVEALRRLL